MCKSFIPFGHAKSIYEIDPSFYTKHGVKTLFMDLDNTLDSYKAKEPKQETIELIKKLQTNNITPVVISNNKASRVSGYVSKLGIEFLASARKPFAKRLLNEISKRNLKKDEVMLVGDQMMTDVLAGKHAGIRVVLTEKIVKEDQFTTHFNRLIDRPIRRHHRKKGNLRNWRDL